MGTPPPPQMYIKPWVGRYLRGKRGLHFCRWEIEGGAGVEGRAPPTLCSINTLANSMKHCINVSNYWLGGRVSGGGG